MIKKTMSIRCPQFNRGMTLVEIMIAITISLILLAGILTILVSSKATYNTQDALSRLQENGRYALKVITERVRNAGFTGCSTGELGSVTNMLNSANTNPFNYLVPIEGYEANGTGLNQIHDEDVVNPAVSIDANNWTATGGGTTANLPADLLANGVIDETDVLVVRGSADNSVKIDRNNDSSQLFIDASDVGVCPDGSEEINGICAGDILIATDCTKSRIFQATNATTAGGGACNNAPCANLVHSGAGTTPGGTPINPGNAAPTSWGGAGAPESEKFGPGAEILKMVSTSFFIGQGANGSPALFIKENGDNPIELIDNVENLQVLYGEDTGVATPVIAGSLPTTATRYVTAAQVGGWDRVVSVRVSLLLRTAAQVGLQIDTDQYRMTGNTNASSVRIDPPDDLRLRRVYSTTIKLRNRGIR